MCGEGEQQKISIARALMAQVELLILDEPCACPDISAREGLLSAIAALAQGHHGSTRLETARHPLHPRSLIMVTHHIEDIPPSFTHVLVLRQGKALGSRTKEQVLTSEVLSQAFDLPIEVDTSSAAIGPMS